jgi:hypothetical protein
VEWGGGDLTNEALTEDGPAVRLPRAVLIEHFDQQALLLLEDSDVLVTSSRATAELVQLLQEAFAGEGFTLKDLASLLQEQYQLKGAAALEEARSLLDSWLKTGLLCRCGGV